MKRMTTHRFLQIHNLEDVCVSKERIARRCAVNLTRIGNMKGADYYSQRADRYARIARKCRTRLVNDNALSEAIPNRTTCKYRLEVEKPNFHPGGTCLRLETSTPLTRCSLKPKKDNFGRVYEILRWIGSGGSPITVAHPCSGYCPLERKANL